MPHLRSLQINLPADASAYPFNVPAIRALTTLDFATPVTFLVGENGSGKSTLLEALAGAAGSTAAGSAEIARDRSLSAARRLAERMKLTWNQKTRKGFFLRAEDFFGYARRLAQMREELAAEAEQIDRDMAGRSAAARALARMPFARELHALDHQYQGDLDQRSHGESFFAFFQARFVPDGLYLLDEPEAPLSPIRQLAFLSMMKVMVTEQRAQFIIATHSPLLMAYPDATILNFDHTPPAPVAYDELEHVRLTRDFLNHPRAFLDRL